MMKTPFIISVIFCERVVMTLQKLKVHCTAVWQSHKSLAFEVLEIGLGLPHWGLDSFQDLNSWLHIQIGHFFESLFEQLERDYKNYDLLIA